MLPSRLAPRAALALVAMTTAVPAFAEVVAQWTMSNDFGTVMTDASGHGNDGTLIDVTTSGSGYMFNGATSHVVVKHSESLTPGEGALTYSAAFQTSHLPPLGDNFDLIRKGASSTAGGGFRLEIQNRKGLGLAYCSVTDNLGHTLSARGRTNLVDGRLHVATCAKTATGLTLTVDDVVERSNSLALGAITNVKNLALGCNSPTCKPGGDYDWYDGILRSATISIDK